jgi:hypothetical protein
VKNPGVYSDGSQLAQVTADMSGVERQLQSLAKAIGDITVQVNPTPVHVAPAQLVAEIDLKPIEDSLKRIADELAIISSQEPPEVNITATPGVTVVKVMWPCLTTSQKLAISSFMGLASLAFLSQIIQVFK